MRCFINKRDEDGGFPAVCKPSLASVTVDTELRLHFQRDEYAVHISITQRELDHFSELMSALKREEFV